MWIVFKHHQCPICEQLCVILEQISHVLNAVRRQGFGPSTAGGGRVGAPGSLADAPSIVQC